MPALVVSHAFSVRYGETLTGDAARAGIPLELLVLPADREARLPEADCARAEVAFFSGDVFPDYSRQFFSAVRKAPALKWLHVFNAGVDHPIYTEMLERGVRVTTSAGSTAEPIAQSAIAGLLMLARCFPRSLEAQRKHVWDPIRAPHLPPDLRGQTAVVLGLGHVGREIARLARVLGLRVIGIRRSALRPGDPVEEIHPPQDLPALLPRCDWLIIACALNASTRGLIDAHMLQRLPQGARIINIARGEIVDETVLIESLRSGRIGGAYLDVFAQEPLPAESPLWDLPNVIISPHNSAAASGNDDRVYNIFLDNLQRWTKNAPLRNEVARAA